MTNEKYNQYYIEYLQSALQEVLLSRISLQANAKMIDEAAGNLLEENRKLIQEIEDLKGQVTYKQYDIDAAIRKHDELMQDIQKKNLEIESLRKVPEPVIGLQLPKKVPNKGIKPQKLPVEPDGVMSKDGGTF